MTGEPHPTPASVDHLVDGVTVTPAAGEVETIWTRGFAVVARVLTVTADMPRPRRQRAAVLMDILLCVMATWLAFALRLGFLYVPAAPFFLVMGAALLCWFPIAWARGIYLSIIRFSGGRTMMGLGIAGAMMATPMGIVFFGIGVPGVYRTIGLLQPMIFVALLGASRLMIRFALLDVLHLVRGGEEVRRVMIYGAGRAGQQLALSLRHERSLRVVGFIDDDRRLRGQRLDNIAVHSADELDRMIVASGVEEVLLALPNASRSQRAAIIDRLQAHKISVRSLPSTANIISGDVSVSDLREVAIEDLLGRDPVAPNELLIGRNIAGKTVLVTGAGGSIGSELCRQILRAHPARLVLVDQSEFALYAIDAELHDAVAAEGLAARVTAELATLADRDSAMRIFRRWKPDTVFHAAAYKHVPLVENNPVAGLKNNVLGTLYAAQAAEAVGVATFILISTDKAVRPTNIMGASKRVCEMILQARAAAQDGTLFTMVRFGNVLGSSGSVVPKFKAQIAAGGPVTLTDRDVTRYFMTIPEAAQLVIQAGAMARGGDVFVLDMGDPVRIIDLATAMIRLSGLSVRDAGNPDGDIAIVEIGLREGEKKYEELLIGDAPEPTQHPRIIKASEAMLAWPELEAALETMRAHLVEGEATPAIAILRTIVPEYVPAAEFNRTADTARTA